MTLADYYTELLKWENQPPRELVFEWPDELIERIKAEVSGVVEKAKLIGSDCPFKAGSTNQSIGNTVEAFIVAQINAAGNFQIENCSGAGYPDRLLRDDELKIPLELRATSNWRSQRYSATRPNFFLSQTARAIRSADSSFVTNGNL